MAAKTEIETYHSDTIHDAQTDYYGKRLATASSDRTIKIHQIADNQQQTFLAELKGHDGPVWQVGWAHPQFGTLLASCSYDKRVFIWKEEANNTWNRIFEFSHTASVNSVAWAPHTLGLILGAASADGTVSVHSYLGDKWNSETFRAHNGGVNAISWSPDSSQGANHPTKRFVTGGCDNNIKIWKFDDSQQKWHDELSEKKHVANNDENPCGHKKWVRDVAWAPSIGLLTNTIASCSEDGTVIIWNEDNNGSWKKSKTLTFQHKIWRVSWSLMGNILAVSQGDNKVSLWKEAVDGNWKELAQDAVDQKDAQ